MRTHDDDLRDLEFDFFNHDSPTRSVWRALQTEHVSRVSHMHLGLRDQQEHIQESKMNMCSGIGKNIFLGIQQNKTIEGPNKKI